MSRYFAPLLALSAALAPAADASDDVQVPLAGKAVVIEVDRYTFVTEDGYEHLTGAVGRAADEGAVAVVLEFDSPGGLAVRSRRALESLADFALPVVSWVKGDAAGGAALVALGADKVFVAPGKAVGGDAEEIEWVGPKSQLPERLADRPYWDVDEEAAFTGLLTAKGVQKEIVVGFCNISEQVVIDGTKYADAGDVLTITREAGETLGLIDGEAADLEGLLAAAGIDAEPLRLPAPEPVYRVADGATPPEAEVTEPDTEPAAMPDAETPASGGAVEGSDLSETEEERNFGETRMESYEGKIVVIEVTDETLMRQTKFEFLQRIVEKANEDGAEAIVFDMDSPGGALWGTMEQMLKVLQNLDVPTYTFVNPRAISAGSMIAVSTDYIYMHPPSTIGSSAVVTSMGGELDNTMNEKVVRTFLAAAKDVANIKGRDYEMVRAFIEIEHPYRAVVPVVGKDGALTERVVVEVDESQLLAMNSTDATQVIDGKPLLAEGIAKTVDELVEKAGLEGELVVAKPLGFEAVADWLVKLAPWLMLFGLAGAYMEMKAPGFGIPGFISIICFGLFFFGHKAAGFLAGYEAIGVFLLGIVFVILELFVFPGLLIFGALGLIMILGSLIYSMVDPVDLGWDGKLDFSNFGTALVDPAFNLVLALMGSSILILLLIRYLPSTPIMRWLILDSGLQSGTGLKLAGDAGALGEAGGADSGAGLIGRSGTADTDLRPSGAASFDGERLDVVSAGSFVSRGTAVRIAEVEGSRIVVEEIPGGDAAP